MSANGGFIAPSCTKSRFSEPLDSARTRTTDYKMVSVSLLFFSLCGVKPAHARSPPPSLAAAAGAADLYIAELTGKLRTLNYSTPNYIGRFFRFTRFAEAVAYSMPSGKSALGALFPAPFYLSWAKSDFLQFANLALLDNIYSAPLFPRPRENVDLSLTESI